MDGEVIIEIVPADDTALVDIARQLSQQLANAGGPVLQLSRGKLPKGAHCIRFVVKQNKSANRES